MKKYWLIAIIGLFLATVTLHAQEPPAPEPEPGPDVEQPEKQDPEKPEEEPKPDDGKIVVYTDIKDYVDDKAYKWRVIESMVARTFELANPEKKEKYKDEWRKRYDWSEYSKKKMEQKLESDYINLRKKKGVDKLKLSHIKVVQWRPKPKEPKKEDESGEKADGDEGKKGEENEESDDDNGKPQEGGEAGEAPEGEGDEPEKPAEPVKKKEWVDPKETADYLVIGEAKFKAGEKAKYFGNTVAWNSLGELHIRVIRRIDYKVIKEFKEELKRSHTLGQERAHQQCMQDIGQKVATAIVNLPVFRKKK